MRKPSSGGYIASAVVALAAALGLAVLISLGLPRPMPVPPPSPVPFPTASAAPVAATAAAAPTRLLPTARPLVLPSLTPPAPATQPAAALPSPTAAAGASTPRHARNAPAPTAVPRKTAAPLLLPSVSINAAVAAQIAEQQAKAGGITLSGLRLTFSNGQAVATGQIRFGGILGMGKLEGPFRLVSRPRIVNGMIKTELVELVVNGADYTGGLYRPLIEGLANGAIEQGLSGRRVAALALEGNVATLVFSRK